MKTQIRQSGFSIIEVVIALVVVGILGFLGYSFYTHQMNKTAVDSSATRSQTVSASDVQSAPEINNVADLNTAETTLDQSDPGTSNSSDSSQLDAELANF